MKHQRDIAIHLLKKSQLIPHRKSTRHGLTLNYIIISHKHFNNLIDYIQRQFIYSHLVPPDIDRCDHSRK